MDKIVMFFFFLIVGAIGVGIFIALLPILLFAAGFVLMIGALGLIAKIVVG